MKARKVLKKFRTEVLGLSQREFAVIMTPYLGVLTGNAHWSRLELGQRDPDPRTIRGVEDCMRAHGRQVKRAGLWILTVDSWFPRRANRRTR